jgi:hypothetical protein
MSQDSGERGRERERERERDTAEPLHQDAPDCTYCMLEVILSAAIPTASGRVSRRAMWCFKCVFEKQPSEGSDRAIGLPFFAVGVGWLFVAGCWRTVPAYGPGGQENWPTQACACS